MDYAAQHNPSIYNENNTEIINAHFQTQLNDNSVLMGLQNLQICSSQSLTPVIHDLIIEKGAAFAICRTNITKRPVKLLVDTGASVTLITSELVKDNVFIQNLKINLFGVTGTDVKIQTNGIAHGVLNFEGNSMGIAMHLVDKKYAGTADGYLGFDFLYQYKTILDLANKKLIYQLNIIPNVTSLVGLKGSNELNTMSQAENLNECDESDECENTNNAFFNIRVIETEPEDILNNYGTESGCPNLVLSVHGSEYGSYVTMEANLSIYRGENKNDISMKWSLKLNVLNECEENEIISYKELEENITNYMFNQENNLKYGAGTKKIPEKVLNVAYMNKMNELCNSKQILTADLCPNIVFQTERAKLVYEKLHLEHCNCQQKQRVAEWCNQFQFQFYIDGDTLSSTNVIKHKIKLLSGTTPIKVKQYRVPLKMRKILDEIIEEYEKQGIIEKCCSPFNFPALVVPKKIDLSNKVEWRFVNDYKKLNAVTEINHFPIPLIEDIINSLHGAKVFTTLDINGCFSPNSHGRKFKGFYGFYRRKISVSMVPHANGLSNIGTNMAVRNKYYFK